MCGKAYEPDLIVAWPSAEISRDGRRGRGRTSSSASRSRRPRTPRPTRAELIEGIRKIIDAYIAAGNAMIDDVIDPRETRAGDHQALEMAAGQARRAAVEEAWGDAGMTVVWSSVVGVAWALANF